MSSRFTNRAVDYRFRILYALGMVFIVAGHLGDGGVPLLYNWFPPYSFHLGLFAFCSGYFYKEVSEEHVFRYCVKKVKHLLIPLYLWNLFYALLIMVMKKWSFTIGTEVTLYKLVIAPLNNGHQFIYNMGGWFVAPLFMIQVFNVSARWLLRKVRLGGKEHILFLTYLLLGMAGIQLTIAGYGLHRGLPFIRTLFLLPFFGAGQYYKKVLERRDNLSNTVYFLVRFSIQLIIAIVYKRIPEYTPSWCNDFYDGPIMPYLVGFTGIAFWLRVARILEPAIGESRMVSLVANNTFSIMINQFLGFMVLKGIFAVFQELGMLSGFDVNLFKTDIWYVYLPGGVAHSLALYLFAGILLPILMQQCIDGMKGIFMKKLK